MKRKPRSFLCLLATTAWVTWLPVTMRAQETNFPACQTSTNDCLVESPGLCVGGSNDGQECDGLFFIPFECPPGPPEANCHVEPGCENEDCCNAVCALDDFCCFVWWDYACAVTAAQVCELWRVDSADLCFDPNDPLGGAPAIQLPFARVFADTFHHETQLDEPGFCCLKTDPGGEGEGTTWFKFVATSDDPTAKYASLAINTCFSVSYVEDGQPLTPTDGIIQVFALGDAIPGTCDDLSSCDVSKQDCTDGSTCVERPDADCDRLVPIACSDVSELGCPFTDANSLNPSLCLDNLVVGDTYYVALAAEPGTRGRCKNGLGQPAWCSKDADCQSACLGGSNEGLKCLSNADCPNGSCEVGHCELESHRGIYEVRFHTPCDSNHNPIPNDPCMNAELLLGNGLSIPFDLSGGRVYDAATFDCPGSTCLPSLENDLWYDWIAPANGIVEVNTCSGFGETTPDTAMVIYDGCHCPVDDGTAVGCSDFDGESDCLGGSRIRFNTEKDHCYKIRLGGRFGDTDVAGDLNVGLEACPSDPVTFDDPVDGTVDARQPHALGDPDDRIGIQRITVTAPPGIDLTDRPDSRMRFSCWDFCETDVDDSGINNRITNFVDNQDGTFTLELLHPITPGAATKITYKAGDGKLTSAVYTSHPGNVDAGPVAEVSDVTALLNYLPGIDVPPWGHYSTDIDHSGSTTPADVLSLIDLLSGGGAFPAWRDTPLPIAGSCD